MKTLDELLAENSALTGDRTKLASGVTLATDLVTASNSIATLTGENTTLKSEKTTLTTQLATANANLGTVTTERDSLKTENATLKAEKKTLNEAVAAKLVELGITDKAGKKTEAAAGGEKLTLTQKCLKKLGKDVNTKVAIGADASAETATEE